MTKEEAKKFVMKTLATGNKERIQLVLKRYYAFLKTAKPEIIDTNFIAIPAVPKFRKTKKFSRMYKDNWSIITR